MQTIRNIVRQSSGRTKAGRTLTSVRDVVDALGGRSQAARYWRVTPSAVANMLADNHISSGHQSRTIVRLLLEGHDIDLRALNIDLARDVIEA